MTDLRIKSGFNRLLTAGAFIALVVLLAVTHQANAQTGSISQSFSTDETKIVEGSLVSLQAGSPGTVELASANNSHLLVGVIGSNPLIELSSNGNVQVITGGTTLALVSSLTGDVKTGDKISASPLLGVGQKAENGVMVIGTAQADLASVDTTEHFITDVDGIVHTVQIGLIPTQIDVVFFSEAGAQNYVPAFLQQLANTVAGKTVGIVQLIIAVLALVLAFVSVGIMLYASVKSSITAIGRNPLSAASVRKSLWQTGFGAAGILATGIIIALFVLRL